MEYKPKYIIVHHSAASRPTPQFDAINQWHKERDFPLSSLGFHVGYHRVIEKDGVSRTARKDLERDCDALGHNFDSLSVCLAGNFDEEMPTEAQRAELARLLSFWCRAYGLTAADIHPHRHFANKSCYGSKLQDNWAALLYLEHEVRQLLSVLQSLTKV